MQTRFVCIILIIILPLTTSLILKIGRNRINTPERLRITRQRQYVIQCCAGHWSCNAAGSSGRLRTVTAPNALKATNEQIIAEDTTIEDETITDISSPINSNANVPITFTVTRIATTPKLSTSVVTTVQTNTLASVISTISSTSAPSLTTTSSILTLPTTGTPPGSSASLLASTSVSTAASLSSTTGSTSTTTSTAMPITTAPTTMPITTAPTTALTTTSTAMPITTAPTTTSTAMPITTAPTTAPTTTSTAMPITTAPTTAPTTTSTAMPTTTAPTTTSTTTTTPCPNACRTSECIAANDTLAAAINAIPSPTLSPSSWPLQTLNGRKYYVDISSAGFTWYAAQAECMKHGMELATIGSQAEHDAITNYIQGAGKGGSEFFIGGNKMGTQCIYVWDNGEPMTYTNWNTGNPAQQTTEECMTWYDGKWSDLPCSWTKWFICEEVDETTTTTTSTTTTSTTTTTTPCPLACKTSSCLASGGLKTVAINGVPSPTLSPSSLSLVTLNGRKYFLEKTSLSWYDSLAFCMKYGMTLASLETQAETDAVNSYIQSQGILLTVFISGNKIGGQCNYGWESGEPMTYTNWYPGDPAQATIEECMVWYDNKWGDFPCDWTRWFLCEQI